MSSTSLGKTREGTCWYKMFPKTQMAKLFLKDSWKETAPTRTSWFILQDWMISKLSPFRSLKIMAKFPDKKNPKLKPKMKPHWFNIQLILKVCMHSLKIFKTMWENLKINFFQLWKDSNSKPKIKKTIETLRKKTITLISKTLKKMMKWRSPLTKTKF
jgi:hypothetical protein